MALKGPGPAVARRCGAAFGYITTAPEIQLARNPESTISGVASARLEYRRR
jgi:hypothetical protein